MASSNTYTAKEMGFGQKGKKNPNLTRVEQLGWRIVDQPGKFSMKPKGDLKIDQAYQRDHVVPHRVSKICQEWSWVALGCLLVARRPDGSLFVIDGQHRKLAADLRADVQLLPCLVFEMGELTEEAKAFIRTNGERSAVGAYGKFKADIIAQDELSMEIKDLVGSIGYNLTQHAKAPGQISCIDLIKKCIVENRAASYTSLKACALLLKGGAIQNVIFGAMFNLEKILMERNAGSILDEHNMKSLKRISVAEIIQKISATKVLYGKSSHITGAQGIVDILNYKRSSNRIAPIIQQ